MLEMLEMLEKWSVFFLILELSSGGSVAVPPVKVVRDGDRAEITCKIEGAPTVVWFRVLDESGMDYIASVTSVNPNVKHKGHEFDSRFGIEQIRTHTLVLKAFRSPDAGAYSCASLQGKDVKFGPVTRLQSVKAAEPAPPTVKTITTTTRTPSPAPCICPTPPAAVGPMHCSLIILAPLAGGCGLLLLLLLCTVLYCNHVRTRRCPHHYKRKPRMVAPGKQLMTNAHM